MHIDKGSTFDYSEPTLQVEPIKITKIMSGLFETKLLKYKKHIIQVFEDMFGQRYVYIDGKTQTYSINNAKRMISLCCQQ